MIDLQKFCAVDTTRIGITKPFTLEDYTYATNGHILIRVPRIEGVGAPEESEKFKLVDLRLLFVALKDYTYHPIPDIQPPVGKQCYKCQGTGMINLCPECDGEGEIEFKSLYNNYSCECKTCDGNGYSRQGKGTLFECNKCHGVGTITDTSTVQASGRYYSDLYLLWLKELPDCVLAEAKELEPGHFKFTGGDGFIMPINKSKERVYA